LTALIVAIAAVAAVALLFVAFRRRRPATRVTVAHQPWTDSAGEEFAGLSEAARCDMAFALSALDDAASLNVLERALLDPSETVALAAAHALARRGQRHLLEAHFAAHPGDRARRLQHALALLDGGV
jgi:HEAT repeat protein